MSEKVNVKYFATFRNITGKKQETIQAYNLKQLINKIRKKHPEIKNKVLKENKEIREGVMVMINGRNVNYLNGLKTELNKNDRISIFPPVAGG